MLRDGFKVRSFSECLHELGGEEEKVEERDDVVGALEVIPLDGEAAGSRDCEGIVRG